MTNKTATVSFFHLSLDIMDHNSQSYSTTDSLSTLNVFENMYTKNMTLLDNGHRAYKIPDSDCVVEVVDFENNVAFLKICLQNLANTVELRNTTTMETEAVQMDKDQLLEVFTLCMLDFNCNIISYMTINSMPRISAIRSFFCEALNYKKDVEVNISAILTKDILEKVAKKQIINKLSVSIAVPSDDVLGDEIGVDRSSFDDLSNVRCKTITYEYTGYRNKNLFKSESKFRSMIRKLMNNHSGDLVGLKVSAKDCDEKVQEYNLLQHRFTKKVNLTDDVSVFKGIEGFKYILKRAYDDNKDELMRYIR